ncbi:hypothetical protein EES43_00720 [Streptomyces sp. ADI96-02]|uniref:hypothetical protein n=1 Tax=Streptomyces sp. ADI96-02 TaxID=1522760 RepID=UPI000F55928D|nr:hypothetical protein [Streptomyces sp. ADI96-02]RPK69085.1 hypothetical protein EES43_00720 [Streptomyces sp. ADI96-02]
MSGNTPTSGLTADYAQRIADDLSANRSEQDRMRTELSRLQAELVQLEESEQVLVKMQHVLGSGTPGSTAGTGTGTAARSAKGGKTATVPSARRAKAGSGAPRKSEAKTTAPKRPAKKTAKKTAKKAAKSTHATETTWRELITDHLAGQGEPRSAAEITTALAEAHPDRKVQVTVVRNTLEQGVAHGLLERSKQGRSVFYSPAAAKDAAPAEAEKASA